MPSDFEAIVIGGGAVGLACAAALGRARGPVLVLEQARHVGAGISSRNSEVVHAGLYYETGSLKHRLCIRGRRLLYDYLDRAGVAHRKCGKLVVATTPRELTGIEALAARAAANGVESIRLLEPGEVRAMEPALRATGALHSPQTGIIDSHGYMLALVGEIEALGGLVALGAPFLSAAREGQGFRVRTGGADPAEISAPVLVNAAGLTTPEAAAAIEGVPAAAIPRLRFAKGCYFGLTGAAPFRRLVYPAPVDGGLGVHATLDLAGRTRFGPDVEWLPETTVAAELDYAVPAERARAFYTAIRRYWPGLPDGALHPDYAGIRPKLSGPGAAPADFVIQGEEAHGLPGLVNLFGIESPGLTASLAIAERVSELALAR